MPLWEKEDDRENSRNVVRYLCGVHAHWHPVVWGAEKRNPFTAVIRRDPDGDRARSPIVLKAGLREWTSTRGSKEHGLTTQHGFGLISNLLTIAQARGAIPVVAKSFDDQLVLYVLRRDLDDRSGWRWSLPRLVDSHGRTVQARDHVDRSEKNYWFPLVGPGLYAEDGWWKSYPVTRAEIIAMRAPRTAAE